MNDISNGVKIIFKQILKYYLKFITKIVLLIHRPLIISVTGSTNEFFVKSEIKRRLEQAGYDVRSNPKNFNTEIGLPLAILNLSSGYNSYKNWLPIIWRAFISLFKPTFPKILVLGLGIDKRGDMKYLMSLVKPKIAIVTDITQRYIESFSDMDDLVGEYKHFVESINENGYLILNYDNRRIKKLSGFTKAKVIFFGLEKNTPSLNNHWLGEITEKTSSGQTVAVTDGNETKNYSINRFGEHHAYALLIGLIVKKIIINLK
ncbi:MAG: Mur ligase family protein [Patescibacteria group bacterium]|jgi:UDP-N-acetylmuramoyl-tripeptide--D-alanyl-D-alanine ligase